VSLSAPGGPARRPMGTAVRAAAWRGAGLGMAAVTTALAAYAAWGLFRFAWRPASHAVALAAILGLAALLGGLVAGLVGLLARIPWPVRALLAGGWPLLTVGFLAPTALRGAPVAALLALACGGLLGAGVAVLRRAQRDSEATIDAPRSSIRRAATPTALAAAAAVVGLAGGLGGAWWLLADARQPRAEVPVGAPEGTSAATGGLTGSDPTSATSGSIAGLADPALTGSLEVERFSYGSGTDHRRPAYGEDATWVSTAVDGSSLVTGWSGLRRWYWGFGPENLPLNGLVWSPVGEGPYPLVLVAHGNHVMTEASEPGYAYLGELLASRGYTVVSIDQNFLNSSPFADLGALRTLRRETALRARLLREHARAWVAWSDSPPHPAVARADVARLALIGHSRGGEAALGAATMDGQRRAPGDARIELGASVGIDAVIALAPADGQYLPGGAPAELHGVSYLVLQGAHDADVFPFQGAEAYDRVDVAPDGIPFGAFKASWYIEGANHGQFNSVWGRSDLHSPAIWLTDRGRLMSGAEQRRFAGVAISAFLDASLENEPTYRELFRDPRLGVAAGWLPETRLISRFDDGLGLRVATFDDDADPGTGSLPGAVLEGRGLDEWREEVAPARFGQRRSRAVRLAWSDPDSDAAFSARLPDPLGIALDGGATVVLGLADGRNATDGSTVATAGARPPGLAGIGSMLRGAQEPVEDGLDVTLVAVDRRGRSARLRSSDVRPLGRIDARTAKAGWMSHFPDVEVAFQDVEIPLSAFNAANPFFDPALLAEIRIEMDRTAPGVLLIDEIRLHPPR